MRILAAASALLLASCNAASAPPDIAIGQAWAHATLPGQSSSAAYFTLTNSGGPDVLLSVSSPAGDASLHSSSTTSGVMKMRPLARLEVPAGANVSLSPGGTHVMIMGLKQPLKPGDAVPLDLKFERSGERHVGASVKSAGAGGAM